MKNFRVIAAGFFSYCFSCIIVFAQPGIKGTDGEVVTLPLWDAVGIANISKYGPIPLLVTIITYAFFLLFMYAVYMVARSSYKYISSAGDASAIQEAEKSMVSIFTGLGLGFLMFSFYVIVSLWIGIGNIFNWPANFSVCGDPGIFLARGKIKAGQEGPEVFDTSEGEMIHSYCCNSFSGVSGGVGNEGFSIVGDNAALVGTDENGGWYFERGNIAEPPDSPNGCSLIQTN